MSIFICLFALSVNIPINCMLTLASKYCKVKTPKTMINRVKYTSKIFVGKISPYPFFVQVTVDQYMELFHLLNMVLSWMPNFLTQSILSFWFSTEPKKYKQLEMWRVKMIFKNCFIMSFSCSLRTMLLKKSFIYSDVKRLLKSWMERMNL